MRDVLEPPSRPAFPLLGVAADQGPSQPWRWRWARFRRDCRAVSSFRTWLPVIAASSLVSGLILGISALQSERDRHELIRRTGSEQLRLDATNLEIETRDWALWEQTYEHASGRKADYYGNGNYSENTFQRIPFVMVLDRLGDPISTAHWSEARQRIEPLPPAQVRQLLELIPARRTLQPRTFLAVVRGQAHLLSLQPILSSDGRQPAVGRLLFAYSLNNAENAIARRALSLERYAFEPLRPLRSAPLGPLAFPVRVPELDGLQPLQLSVQRPARERHNALRSLALLLGLNLVVLVGLWLYAYRQRRLRRRQSCQQQRERQALQRALERRTTIDPLTGKLNVRGLLTALQSMPAQTPAGSRALLLIDIRQFATINNSFGRAFGDRVLIAFAGWLERELGSDCLIARTATDEFACCLSGPSQAELRARINSLTTQMQHLDLPVGERMLRIATSAGARFLGDGSPLKALHETGMARDLAKRSGRQQCRFFGDEQTSMQTYIALQRLNQDLITSLKEDRIVLFAQAAWRLEDPELPAVYVEFLSRIHDPAATGKQRHRWSDALVEAATTCGTMPLLDIHVLELSFRGLRTLLSRHGPDHPVHRLIYAINLTADTLLADDLVSRVEELLSRQQLDPRRVCFEITEQAAVRNLEVVANTMQRLRALGIRFALDDFGAGMTSLSHLHDLPLDYVKIDKAFVWRVQGDPSSRLTVDFLVRMGRELGFEVIAEGVEDVSLLYFLRDLGVTIAQGYVTSIPSPFDPMGEAPGFSRCGRERLEEQFSLTGGGGAGPV